MQVWIAAPRHIKVGGLGKVFVKAVAQTHSIVDELLVQAGKSAASVPSHRNQDGATKLRRKMEKPARFGILRHFTGMMLLCVVCRF